jgi:hypothetical protein
MKINEGNAWDVQDETQNYGSGSAAFASEVDGGATSSNEIGEDDDLDTDDALATGDDIPDDDDDLVDDDDDLVDDDDDLVDDDDDLVDDDESVVDDDESVVDDEEDENLLDDTESGGTARPGVI